MFGFFFLVFKIVFADNVLKEKVHEKSTEFFLVEALECLPSALRLHSRVVFLCVDAESGDLQMGRIEGHFFRAKQSYLFL